MNDQIIYQRRSIRRFSNQHLNENTLQKIYKAAFNAPSAMNRQPWELIVINQKPLLAQIAKAHPHAPLQDAPVAIVVCGNT